MRILLVEDDSSLREAIAKVLEEASFQVDQAASGDDGLMMAETEIYDVLVVDIMLPGMDGLALMRSLRKKGIYVPSIFLTAKDSVESRVAGLNAGADDYLVKPFAVEELIARINALFRRSGQFSHESGLQYGAITLSTKEHDAYVEDVALKLTIKEYELLEYLMLNKEQILTRAQLLNRVWGIDSDANDSVVDLYIHYLRKKLSNHGLDHYIRTVRSVGYILKED